jgi:hypothetical protein
MRPKTRQKPTESSYVDGLGALQLGKSPYGSSRFLLCEPQLVKALEIEPKLRAGAEEMSEAQGGIAGDGTSSIQDLGDAVGWHVNLSRKFRCAHIECLQFFSQVFTRMNSISSHSDSPSGSQQSQHSTAPASGQATEANPPLIVYADAVLSLTVANQGLKAIAGQYGKVSQ